MTNSVGVLLDIGCGKGFFVKTALENGWYTYGIDISKRATHYANSRLGLNNIKCGNVEEAEYQNNFFDVITIWETIEHLEKPWSMLKVAFNLLKPGGKLFISTPNAGSLYVTILGDKWHGFSDLHFQNHIVYYNPKTLQIACRRIGFTDIRLMTVPPPPQLPDLLPYNLMFAIFGKTKWFGTYGRMWKGIKMTNMVLNKFSKLIKSNDTLLCIAKKPYKFNKISKL